MELFWKNTESLFCRQATLKDKHFTFLLLLSRAEKNSIKFWQLKKGRKIQFSSVQSLSHVRLFATPWTAARQTSLPFTISWSLLKLMSIKSMMPFKHLILFHPLFLPSIFLSMRVFSSELALRIRWPKYWSFILSISPSNEYSGLILSSFVPFF